MGCGGAKFTEDESVFFKGAITRDPQNVSDALLSDSIMKVNWRKDMKESQDDDVIKRADGTELLKVVPSAGKAKLYTMKDEFLCMLVFNVHYSEVNAVDAAFNLPHVYVYTLKPFQQGQEATENKEKSEPLFMWARIHKVSNVGIPKFEVAYAEFKGTPSGGNLEKFGYKRFTSTLFPDGRMEILKEGKGCCRVEFADDEKTKYDVSIAQYTDPALMLCTIMGMESLKDRTTK